MKNKLLKARNKFRPTDRRQFLEEPAHTYLEDYDEETQWLKKICNLFQEPSWNLVILVGGFYSMQTALMAATISTKFKRTQKVTELFYAADICWFVDLSLRLVNLKAERRHITKSILILMTANFLSIIPLEIILSATMHKENDMYMLNRVLKIVHVCYLFKNINTKVTASVTGNYLQALYLLTVFVFLATFVFAFYTCFISVGLCANINDPYKFFLYYINILCDSATMKGFGQYKFESIVQKSIILVTSISMYLFIFCLYMAYITYVFFVTSVHKSTFRYKYMALKKYLKYLEVDEEMVSKVDLFFDNMWSICKGYTGYMAEVRVEYPYNQFEHILPRSYFTEIQMDVCLSAFHHTKLLKILQLSIIRDLTCVMKQQIYVSGQYVYHKDEMKDKMVYVFRGILQIISEEDGETALVSLSDGSCIGESSLIFPYKSTFNVRCLTTCILHVLERTDFVIIGMKYPLEYRRVYEKVQRRYTSAMDMHKIKLVVNKKEDDLLGQCMSTMWLNYTLHKIMGEKDFDSAKKHAVQNIYTQDKINETTFNSHLFTANYLCLYALAERARINSDTLFVKNIFPYMLKPNTGLVLFWEIMICVLALVAAVHVPYLSLIHKSRTAVIYSSFYGYTTVWWMDLIVQCRTAIELKHAIVSNMKTIIAIRLQNPIFILDILSCVPLELFSSIFQNINKSNLYMPRILKLGRVFNLVKRWEAKYNSNPLVVRITCVTIVIFYLSYFLACFYFTVDCLGKCDAIEMYTLIFYAVQIVTGVALWVPGYSNLESYMLPNVIVFISMSVLFSVIYGYIFSGFAFYEMHRTSVRANVLQLIVASKSMSTKLINRLAMMVRTDTYIANNLNFMEPAYVFRCLPKPLVGHMFYRLYNDWIIDLPIFAGLPNYVVLDILQNGGYVYTVGPNVTLFHVGDLLKDVIILAEGYCERICGVSQKLHLLSKRLAFNDVEIILNIPTRSTVHTISHCEMIKIDFFTMRKVLTKYKSDFRPGRIREKILNFPVHTVNYDLFHLPTLDIPTTSFVPDTNSKGSKRAKFNLTSLVLLRFTILPHGHFFTTWEYFRSCCAVLSSIIYPTTMVIFLPRAHPVSICLWFLDASAVIDIYVRMHICYYDKRGILITNPVLTARNYLSKSFIVDFLGVFPTHLIVTMNRYVMINVNHVLQLHRYYGLMVFKYSNAVAPISKLYIFAVLPIFIIFLNILSSIYVSVNCEVDYSQPDFLLNPMNCSRYSIFRMNDMKVVMSPFVVHLYSYYLFMSTVSTIGFQGFTLSNNYTMALICAVSIVGFYWNTMLAANMFRHYMFENVNQIYWDGCKRRLHRIMAKTNVAASLVNYVDDYLKTCSLMMKYSLHDGVKNFATTLQRDFLYERYGKGLLKDCLIDSTDFDQFIRNILLSSEYKIIETDGFVYSLNDILDETFFIYSGVVELISPDGISSCSLKPGSILGNLCCMTYNRMCRGVLAKGVVEVISVKTTNFFQILQHFPSTKKQFEWLKSIHINHIPGYSKFEYVKSVNVTSKYLLTQSSWTIYGSAVALLFFGTYFAQFVYLYQISLSEFSYTFTLVNNVCDVFYVASLAFNLVMPLNTEQGIIKDQAAIKAYWFKNNIYLLSIFACIPFYFIGLFLPLSASQFYYGFMFLRFNVMLRIFHAVTSFRRLNEQWNLRMFVGKISSMMMVTALLMVIWTALMMVSAHFTDHNISKHINTNMSDKSSLEKFQLFLKWFGINVNAFTHGTQIFYYPVGTTYVMIFIALSTFWMMFVAIFFSLLISLFLSNHRMQWSYIYSLDRLYSYMHHSQVSANLNERVREYAELVWKTCEGSKQTNVMDTLPRYLRESVMGFMYGHLIGENTAFVRCHPDFRRQLVALLKYEIYNIGDFIVYKGAIDSTMYWVDSGTVVSLSEVSEYCDNHIKVYVKGECFGMAQGVYELTPHLFSYKATSICTIVSLTKNDWEHLMAFFPASRRFIYTEARARGDMDRNLFNSLYKDLNLAT